MTLMVRVVDEPAPARPFVPHGLAIFTTGIRRASSSLTCRLIASSCRARTNRSLVAEGWYFPLFTLYRHDSGSPAALFPKIACKTAKRPVSLQFSKKSRRETQSRDDRSAGKWPVAVSTQRPEPLPPRCGRGFIVRPTMRHLLRPVPGHMRNHLAALSTNPPAPRGRPCWFGTRMTARLSRTRFSRSGRDACFSRTRISRLFRNSARLLEDSNLAGSRAQRDRKRC